MNPILRLYALTYWSVSVHRRKGKVGIGLRGTRSAS